MTLPQSVSSSRSTTGGWCGGFRGFGGFGSFGGFLVGVVSGVGLGVGGVGVGI